MRRLTATTRRPGRRPTLAAALVGAVALPLAAAGGAGAAPLAAHRLVPHRAPTATDSAYAWGSDGNFQACSYGVSMPDGSQQEPVQGLGSTTQIAAGSDFALYLQADGTVRGCGQDGFDELGDGGVSGGSGDQTSPVTPLNLSHVTVTEVAAGSSDGYALTSTGAVYAWGSDSQGGLGDGGVQDSSSNPQLVTLPTITEIAAGADFAMALDSTGHVWTWGMDQSGEIGNGGTFSSSTPPVATPYEVPGLSGVTSIAAGESNNGATFYEHTLAVSGGTVDAWGADNFGQLGNGTTEAGDSTPEPVTIDGPGNTPVTVTSVAAGGGDSFAVTSSGDVYAFGGDGSGVLGDGTTGETSTPVELSGLSSVAGVAAGAVVTSARTTSGELYTWGQLGSGVPLASPTPAAAPIGVVSVACGFGTYYAAAEDPSGLEQTAPSTSLAEGASAQLHATATYPAGAITSPQDATAAAVWSSSAPALVAVSASGVARALAPSGSATITATLGPMSATSTVTATPSGISITPSALPAGVASSPYSAKLAATGGTGPYQFTLVGGTLPPKVTLTTAGVLAGTPAKAGTAAIEIEATGADGRFTVVTYRLVIALAIGPAKLPVAKLHKTYRQQISAFHGTAPYRFSLHGGKLPPGLKLFPGGLLTGKATTTGKFSFSVAVSDHGSPASKGLRSYTLTVNPR